MALLIRHWARFETDLPDGAVEDERDFIVWPGRPVTEAVSEKLHGLGFDVSEPIDLEFKGWSSRSRLPTA